MWLVKAMVMECYAWLPPGSYPASSHLLFKWATSTVRTKGSSNMEEHTWTKPRFQADDPRKALRIPVVM